MERDLILKGTYIPNSNTNNMSSMIGCYKKARLVSPTHTNGWYLQV